MVGDLLDSFKWKVRIIESRRKDLIAHGKCQVNKLT
jgi:hypothetical protein